MATSPDIADPYVAGPGSPHSVLHFAVVDVLLWSKSFDLICKAALEDTETPDARLADRFRSVSGEIAITWTNGQELAPALAAFTLLSAMSWRIKNLLQDKFNIGFLWERARRGGTDGLIRVLIGPLETAMEGKSVAGVLEEMVDAISTHAAQPGA